MLAVIQPTPQSVLRGGKGEPKASSAVPPSGPITSQPRRRTPALPMEPRGRGSSMPAHRASRPRQEETPAQRNPPNHRRTGVPPRTPLGVSFWSPGTSSSRHAVV
ncbi:unnamed protein product [Ixodes pacificus]